MTYAMKKRNDTANRSVIALYILIVLMVVISVSIITLNLLYQTKDDFKSLLISLLDSLLSAVTVGLIATTFSKIITNNFAIIKRNNQKLSAFGVREIGTGVSTKKDSLDLFGNPYTGVYPRELKIMFISGNGFFSHYKNDLTDCLRHGCLVKILLLSTEDANQSYLSRMNKLCPQTTAYKDQVDAETLSTLRSVFDSLDAKQRQLLQVRFYRDEYRYNFRIAKYCDQDNRVSGQCWLNIQPFNRNAVDMSIALKGGWDATSEDNFFATLDDGFDRIWHTYPQTEYRFNDTPMAEPQLRCSPKGAEDCIPV